MHEKVREVLRLSTVVLITLTVFFFSMIFLLSKAFESKLSA